jgi:hypothetical protein
MVVPSPIPSPPSASVIRTITMDCRCIVAMASTWGRIVGKSTMKLSILAKRAISCESPELLYRV